MTDMITVSRKEIDKMINEHSYVVEHSNLDSDLVVSTDDLRALLDKAEVSEPVSVDSFKNRLKRCCEHAAEYQNTENLKESLARIDLAFDQLFPNTLNIYTSPPDQSAKIAELEAEVSRLNAIIEDIKTLDNVFVVDDKKDAERYRTIRKSGNDMRVVFGKYPDGINIHASENHLCGTALDEAIDLAMKAK